MSVHLSIGPRQVACNYNRWRDGSMVLTSNKSRASVTCHRCLATSHFKSPKAA